MKTLTTRDMDETPRPALTRSEHALVEFDMQMSGRSAIRNAVLRKGNGYMRQIATLPPCIEPPAAPQPAPVPRPRTVWLEALAIVVITVGWLWLLALVGQYVWRHA